MSDEQSQLNARLAAAEARLDELEAKMRRLEAEKELMQRLAKFDLGEPESA